MAQVPASRLGSFGSPPCDIRIQGKSACRLNPDRVPGGAYGHRSFGKTGHKKNRSFFLTPDELNNPSLGIPQDSALETGTSLEPREAVELAESGLGFHNTLDPSASNPNVSSFQRAFTDLKVLKFTH